MRLVSAQAGFVASVPERDFGVDLQLKPVTGAERGDGRTRYRFGGYAIELQLKATVESQVTQATDGFTYALRAKNYNDLVERKGNPIPLVLALFVLPDDPQSWLTVAEDAAVLKRCAYYWRPGDDDAITTNVSTKSILVRSADRFTAGGLEFIAAELTG